MTVATTSAPSRSRTTGASAPGPSPTVRALSFDIRTSCRAVGTEDQARTAMWTRERSVGVRWVPLPGKEAGETR